MNRRTSAGDIPLEPPLVRHPDVVPAVEDRSYVVFIAGAMFMALAVGFSGAVVVSLSAAGVFWENRLPWLVQAHGWAQLEGWAGLFVAGMGFRLLPRFAGRRPLPRRANFGVFGLLFAGVIVRSLAQPFAGDGLSDAGFLLGQLLWAAGAAAFSAVVFFTLLRGKGHAEPWRLFAFAGAGWWAAWAAASVAAGVRGERHDAFVPVLLDDPLTWVVMLGAVGNFIWGVQSRAVPVFFGRRPPKLRMVLVPGLLLNTGLVLAFTAGWVDDPQLHERLMGLGFLGAAIALACLAPIAGSCWGKATRLRPRARAAARFVLAANIAALVCAALLAWAGARTLMEDGFAAQGARDAARHAFGAGVITLLIVGMAQLVAPFFAMRRVEPRTIWVDDAVLGLLVAAAVLRVLAGLLDGQMGYERRMHLNATAGALAWLGLALFAATAVRAIRDEPRIKASLATAASGGPIERT